MNSIFTEENLLAFAAAARFGSLSKAVEELGLTTSAISYIIKRMETGLDVVLFTRSTCNAELTESGRYFFRKATDSLNNLHTIKRSTDTISQGIEARARICINQLPYTPKHTARLLRVLRKQFPACQTIMTIEMYNGVQDAIINSQANIATGALGTLLDGGGIDYTGTDTIRWIFAIAPGHLLAFVLESIAESQLYLYSNIVVKDTAHTINKRVGWSLHEQESILVPDSNIKCQCQILGEGIGFLSGYMVREAIAQSLLVTRQVHNPYQDSHILLATQHFATDQVTQWIKKQFTLSGMLTEIYQDLLHRENQSPPASRCVVDSGLHQPSAFITHSEVDLLLDTGGEYE